jgi:serine/threonine-protein kinase
MSRDDRRTETLAPGLAARLDPVCDRFESEWLAGRRPRLEDYVSLAEENDRPALLRELLALDCEYRVRHGERPAPDDYLPRFPDHAAVIEAALGALSSVSLAAPAERTPMAGDLLPAAAQTVVPGAAPVPRAGRYQIEGEIGRGGMGTVLRARDPDLNRPLAIKVLSEACHGRPELERRFREEAQVTGQLQHPGVPPVHEVGTLPDGRPFFAMKLIQGRTLAELLGQRPSPRHDLPRFLTIFEQVCQTLAYAHSRGVIHRDLKPSNMMVGAFGEVQVMDWGLAKVLADRRRAPTEDGPTVSGVATVRTGVPHLESQAGAVMGTPAFMAPEQARGEIDQLDERCDVFGLGAILCVILVGRPPYQGPTTAEVHARAARGDLGDAVALLESSGCDAELIALARRCLAADRDDRPRAGGAVAEAMSAYLAGVQERLRAAERERAAAEARAAASAARARAERRAKRLLLGLAASVLVTATAGSAVALWVQHDRATRAAQEAARAADAARKEDEAVHDITASLDQAEQWRRKGQLADARAVARKAEGLLSGGGEPLRPRVEEMLSDLGMLDRLGEVGLETARVTTDPAKPDAGSSSRSEQGPAGFGFPVLAIEAGDAAPQYEQAFAGYGIPVLTLEPAEAARRVRERAIRADLVMALDSWAELVRDLAVRQRLLEVARLADPDPEGAAAELRAALAEQDPAALRRLLADDERVSGLPPPTLVYVARNLRLRGDAPQAVRLLQTARERYPGDFWANYELAAALSAVKPFPGEEALRSLTVSVALRPDNAQCRYNLGVALRRLSLLREAAVAFRKAAELKPDFTAAHYNLGVVLAGQGDSAGARRAYGKAERGLREAARLTPSNADAHHDLGAVLADLNRLDEAIREFTAARAIAPDDPKIHKNLGQALGKRGNWGEAEKSLREAIRLAPDDAEMHNDLGFTLYSQRRFDAAITSFRKALDLRPDFVVALINLGNALDEQGHPDEAIDAYRKAIKSDPNSAKAYNGLGIALYRKNDLAGAAAAYRDAIRVQPEFAPGHYNLGDALCLQRDFAAGIAACEKAIEINPSYAEAHVAIGMAQLEQGHFAEGITRLERGHDLLDRTDPRRLRVRAWLDDSRDLARLADKLPAVLKGDAQPANNIERVRLAMICVRYQQLPVAASRLYLEAFTAEPRLGDDMQSGARYLAACAAALAGSGRGKDAGRLPDKEQHMWRVQARDWLRANLTWWGQALDKDRARAGPVLRQVLAQWQADANLAGVRDREALDGLPEDERRQWRGLWDDVARLLAKAGQQ